MTVGMRYVICRVGRYPVVVRAKSMIRIWSEAVGDAPGSAFAAEPIDFRFLLGGSSSEPGIAIAVDASDTVGVIVVDHISGMATLAEEDFFPLPPVFGFARGLFDAACRRGMPDGYPLRLRAMDHAFGMSC